MGDQILNQYVHCPNCGSVQYCPCTKCRESHQEALCYIYVDEKTQACAVCNFAQHPDFWSLIDQFVYEYRYDLSPLPDNVKKIKPNPHQHP